MKFSDIVGQDQAKKLLSSAVKYNKISNAYIISGEKGCGKKMLANAFATALMCEKGEGEACGECPACKQTANMNNPDVIYVTHEKPNVIGIDEIRSQLNSTVDIKPYKATRKLYIIDDAQLIGPQGQNALLKTIEEPPEYVTILFLTTNLSSFLPTILSRCVKIEMKALTNDQVRDALVNSHKVALDRVDVCAAFAQGNLGKAFSLVNDEEFLERKNDLINLLASINKSGAYEMSGYISSLGKDKSRIDEALSLITLWMKDVLLYKSTADTKGIVFLKEADTIKMISSRMTYEGLGNVIDTVEKTKDRLKYNVNTETALELLLYSIKENTKNA